MTEDNDELLSPEARKIQATRARHLNEQLRRLSKSSGWSRPSKAQYVPLRFCLRRVIQDCFRYGDSARSNPRYVVAEWDRRCDVDGDLAVLRKYSLDWLGRLMLVGVVEYAVSRGPDVFDADDLKNALLHAVSEAFGSAKEGGAY